MLGRSAFHIVGTQFRFVYRRSQVRGYQLISGTSGNHLGHSKIFFTIFYDTRSEMVPSGSQWFREPQCEWFPTFREGTTSHTVRRSTSGNHSNGRNHTRRSGSVVGRAREADKGHLIQI